MKILNYGAGAVGLGLSSCLLKSGVHVDIIARPKTVAALKRNGLVRHGIFGRYKAPPKSFGAYFSLGQIKGSPYDFILVTTKSFDSKAAAQDIARHKKIFNKNTKIILCQNGWGNSEIFTSFFPRKQIYNARVITGFTRPKPNEVVITVHADSIKIGSLFTRNFSGLNQLTRAISEGGIPCRVSREIEKDLWAKMLYNCALNSLGAIFDVPYGVLGEQETKRKLMNEIIREVFKIITRAGYKTHWKTPDDYLKVFYTKQLPPTAKHSSSTLQDIKAKKKTEIDALNGIVIKLAEEFKVAVPVNRAVYSMVKFIEERNLARR